MSIEKKESSLKKSFIELFVSLGINVLLAWIFPIHAEHCYGWTGGLWHGSTWVGNWILSLFNDGRLLMAPLHTGAYKFWFWVPLVMIIFWLVVLVLSLLLLLFVSTKRKK